MSFDHLSIGRRMNDDHIYKNLRTKISDSILGAYRGHWTNMNFIICYIRQIIFSNV